MIYVSIVLKASALYFERKIGSCWGRQRTRLLTKQEIRIDIDKLVGDVQEIKVTVRKLSGDVENVAFEAKGIKNTQIQKFQDLASMMEGIIQQLSNLDKKNATPDS